MQEHKQKATKVVSLVKHGRKSTERTKFRYVTPVGLFVEALSYGRR